MSTFCTQSENRKHVTIPWQSSLTLAEKARHLGHMIWFDSNTENDGKYDQNHDIITASPELMIHAIGTRIEVFSPDTGSIDEYTKESPFDFIEKLLARYPRGNTDDNLPFTGGLAGYWGYELNHTLEPKCIKKRKHTLPDMAIGLYLWALVIEKKSKKVTLIFHPDIAENKRNHIIKILGDRSEISTKPSFFYLNGPFVSQTTPEEYFQKFNRVKEYIYAGDCYQVNLTQCFTATYEGDLWDAYRLLRRISPSPFSAWFDSGKVQLSCHSPERFVRLEGNSVLTCPVKGTRPRSNEPVKDKQLGEELLASVKDRAENLMIVDLLRNDLNRHCEINSVKTTQLFSLESYSNVHHLVSRIEGILKADVTPTQLLKGAFPGGSVTGAPKIRAMQIIRELEPHTRQAYCGAIGYVSFNGNMDTNIPIRTLSGHQGELNCWGGGAIVADSDAKNEYHESIVKISNLTRALEQYFLKRR